MPCATIHMLTAGRTLASWEDDPDRAPFPVHRPELVDAFLLGAMGPDMGFVPGVDRFVSELAHYVSTGDLVRTLLDEAGSPAEEAFAWGWATHHRTDVEIHPLIGRACGEKIHGDVDVRMNASEDCATHVAIEVGLDITVLLSDPEIPEPPKPPGRAQPYLDPLGRALESTYGLEWTGDEIRRDHVTSAIRTSRWPRLLRLLARARRFSPGEGVPQERIPEKAARTEGGPTATSLVLGPVLNVAGWLVPSDSAAAGFLRPVTPPSWLVREVRHLGETFPERFRETVEERMADVENRNLETGLLEAEPQRHPASEATRSRLEAVRSAPSDAGTTR